MPLFGGLVEEVDQRNQLRIGNRCCAVRPVVEDGERGSQADGDLLASETRNDELQQTLTGAFLHGGAFSARLDEGPAQSVPPWTNWRFIYPTECRVQKEKPGLAFALFPGLCLKSRGGGETRQPQVTRRLRRAPCRMSRLPGHLIVGYP